MPIKGKKERGKKYKRPPQKSAKALELNWKTRSGPSPSPVRPSKCPVKERGKLRNALEKDEARQ